MLLSEICGLVSVGRPLWREGESAICSVITQWSETRRTRNYTLLSHLRLLQPGGSGSLIYILQNSHISAWHHAKSEGGKKKICSKNCDKHVLIITRIKWSWKCMPQIYPTNQILRKSCTNKWKINATNIWHELSSDGD
jgi:hypothetical protein